MTEYAERDVFFIFIRQTIITEVLLLVAIFVKIHL